MTCRFWQLVRPAAPPAPERFAAAFEKPSVNDVTEIQPG
jgi:hypothetical protein